MMWIRRLIERFQPAAPARPPLAIVRTPPPLALPPPPVQLPPGLQQIDEREPLWIAYCHEQAVAWGLTRAQAMERAWIWGEQEHQVYAQVGTYRVWIKRSEILGFLALLGLSVRPNPPRAVA